MPGLRGALAERPVLAYVAATATLSLLLWAAYGAGAPGYDQLYALIWGDDLAEGRLPDYEAPRAPTPHPLANLVGLALAPLGDGSLPALAALGVVSYAALGVAGYALGARVFSPAVGVAFAAILLTRPLLVTQTLVASIDVPYLALVLAAAALEAAKPRRGVAPLVLLGVAGLLRPEGWLLAGAYTLLCLRGASARRRAGLVALAAAPPLLWMASDLVIAGDPLWSMHQARATAERLGDDSGPVGTLVWAAKSWNGILKPVVAIAAVGGLVALLRARDRRAEVPAGLLAFGTLSFLAIGFAGLPLYVRYFFVPATILSLLAAYALLGWRDQPEGSPLRRVWAPAAAVLAVALAVELPWQVDRLNYAADRGDRNHRLHSDLRDLAERPLFRAILLDCRPLQTRLFRARPVLLWIRRDETPVPIVATTKRELGDGLLLRYAHEDHPPPAPGFRPVDNEGVWTLLERCPSG